jgi:alpha-N-acetylgalactosaminidase
MRIAGLLTLLDRMGALDNGLAKTPPMGWLSWERYGCNIDCAEFPNSCISEKLYMDMADMLVLHGLDKLGYTYVNVDDCWSTKARGAMGELKEDPIRFPHGMKFLSEYIHSKNLHFGLYTDIGTMTCGGYPGLGGGFLKSDVAQFLDWQIDSIKVDGCYADVGRMGILYAELSGALNATKRPILYSCSWPAYQGDHCENPQDMAMLKNHCNLWRNYGDIEDSWASVKSIVQFWSRTSFSDIMVSAAGPGHWNDPDMLLVGNPGLSISEQRAQFALWAILAAPLYISSDLRKISTDSLEILKNEEVIAINQDSSGQQGYVLSDDGPYRVWIRHLSNERIAVLFENKASIFEKIKFHFFVTQLGWARDCHYSVRDVHAHSDVVVNQSGANVFIVDVDESSVELFIFSKITGSVLEPEDDDTYLVEIQ